MNRSVEIDIFLKWLSSIYMNNPNLEITNDTIYDQLRLCRINNNQYEYIENIDISHVQNNMNSKYRNMNDDKLNIFRTSYFWVFENHGDIKNDEDFKSAINNSIKMYISVDENSIEYVADQIFEFMRQNNIVTQSKISKKMRNDALVLRVATIEDAKKISDFVNNKLNYISKNKPNPFLYNEGKVSIAADGVLSFNSTISNIMAGYIYNRRNNNMLEYVGYNDFLNYLNYEYRQNFGISDENYINVINQLKNGEYVDRYHYEIGIYHMLKNNLNGNINSIDAFSEVQNQRTLERVFGKKNEVESTQIYEPTENMDNDSNTLYITNINYDFANYYVLLNMMLNYYSLEDTHHIFCRYIETGDIARFTRREVNGESIRNFVSRSFNPKKLYDVMNNALWINLVNAFRKTYEKYNYDHAMMALKKLLLEDNYNSFTNDDNVRRTLKMSGPLNNLKYIIYEKVTKSGNEYTVESAFSYIFNEMNGNNQTVGTSTFGVH